MSDRLAEIVLGLQRLAESERGHGNDLLFMHQQDIDEHVGRLDHLISMVDKLRNSLLEDRKRFMPPAERMQYEAQGRAMLGVEQREGRRVDKVVAQVPAAKATG